MANQLGATSTTDEVLTGINLHGKRILVTGVSAGLGVETALPCVSWRTCHRRSARSEKSRGSNYSGRLGCRGSWRQL